MQPLTTDVNLTEAAEIEAMLPWLATSRLTTAERVRITTYVDAFPAVAPLVIMAREERISCIIDNEAIAGPSRAALDRLMAAIAITPQPRCFKVPSISGAWQRFTALLGNPSPNAIALASGAAAIVMLVQAIAIGTLLPTEGMKFKTAFDTNVAVTAGGIEMLVSLQPGVTAKDLNSTLSEFNAVIIDGPKNGLYRLRVGSGKVPSDVAARTTDGLKARQDIFAFAGRAATPQ